MMRLRLFLAILSIVHVSRAAGAADLVIADGGKTSAVVVVSPKAGTWEKRAGDDLVHFIHLMSGAKPVIANTDEAIAALKPETPALVVGGAALKAEPSLQQALDKVAKKEPTLRA